MEKIQNHNSQYFYISCLNVFSAIAVVILHANSAFWYYRNDFSWAINNFIECTFYFAVPVFFMLTGSTLLDYTDKYDTKTFFRKRIEKTVIPFLFWSVFALLLTVRKDPQGFIANELTFEKIFNGIINTAYAPVYWFFIPLFCVYLSIPLFANILKDQKMKTLNYIGCAAFMCNILIPFAISYANNFLGRNISWNFEIPVLNGFIIYPVLGYLLHHYPLDKKQRTAIYLAALGGFAVHLFGTYYLSQKQAGINEYYKGYMNLPCVLYSMGVFVFVKYTMPRVRSNAFQRFILHLQKYTFEIYLFHMFLLTPIARKLNRFHIVDTMVLYVVMMTVIAIAVCVVITFILRKILKLKVIVP